METRTTRDVGLRTHVFTSRTREFGRHGQTFSPTTSTLVTGTSDAVLVDAQFIGTEVAALGDLIEASGKRLTAIYITHGHADHYFGIGELIRRFPGARPIATAGVHAVISKTHQRQIDEWDAMFGDAVTQPDVLPEVLTADTIPLEGHELKVVEVGQGDIPHSTVVHIPALDTVIAGDVAYNRIHPMLGFAGPQEWQGWIESLDRIEALRPRTVVAGHKAPDAADDDIETIIGGTRDYIRTFRTAVAENDHAEGVIAALNQKYGHYGNPFTLHYSANAVFRRKE